MYPKNGKKKKKVKETFDLCIMKFSEIFNQTKKADLAAESINRKVLEIYVINVMNSEQYRYREMAKQGYSD